MARRCDLTGKGVLAGNNVSHANNRTRRRFLPNIQVASMMSDALGEVVRFRVSTRGLRTVEQKGGIDAYLLGARESLLSETAKRIKRRVQKVLAAKELAAKETAAAG